MKYILVFVMFIFMGCSDKEKIENIPLNTETEKSVVVIDNDKYTREDIINYAFYALSEMDEAHMKNDEIKAKLIDDFINHKLIFREAIKDNVNVDMEKIDNLLERICAKNVPEDLKFTSGELPFEKERFKKIIYEHFVVQNYLNSQVSQNIKVDEAEIKEYYQAYKTDFAPKKLYHIYHIFNPEEKIAYEARQKLYERNSFESVAKKYSLDSYGEVGGDMGFVDIEQMPAVFQHVKSLRKGKISKVIKSEYGYHIFYLKDIDSGASKASLEDVSGEIYARIYDKKQQEFINNLIKELRKNAEIIIDSSFSFNDLSIGAGKGN